MTNRVTKFGALKLTQPIGEFFVARLDAHLLASLTKADVRRVSDRELESRTGIQRGLNQARVSQIANYISTVDASFPNSIILNLNPEHLKDVKQPVEEKTSVGALYVFEINEHEDAFSIIDGQHRLAGFEKAEHGEFELVVTFFIDLPIEEQAYLFSTINLTQQKVNKSLVFDLFDVAKTRSPQRTAHLITRALNSDEDSALYRRIKLLGAAPRFNGDIMYHAPLSQGTVAGRIMQRISKDPIRDRDTLRKGGKIETAADTTRGLIFREYFAENKDAVILKILSNYFSAVSAVFGEEWNSDDSPLAKTIGYDALLKLLDDVYVIGVKEGDLSHEFFLDIMKTIKANRDREDPVIAVNLDAFPPTGVGVNRLYRQLQKWAGIS